MRGGFFFLLLVSAACSPFSRGSKRVATSYNTCSLAPVAGIIVNLPHAQQAMRDFEREVGHPYSLLYVDLYAGSPLSDSRCIRLVQQAESQFTLYNYHNQQAKGRAVTNPTWGQSFAQVGEGHFMGMCTGYASEPAEGIWLVKRDSTVIFGLDISLREQEDFTGKDKVRVDAARSLLRRIISRND
jgi:hypothetical protein